SEIVKVEIEEQHLTKFELYQNYPNPFNPSTTIKFAIPSVVTSPDRIGTKQSVQTSLKIYDILGREVATLVNETLKPGNYEVNFDANRLSSGMYFYSLTTSGKTIIKKMMLIR
ncbi:MAG: T9SS type A sorting domain-containing protein, partial [Melioribacteraceae bacterium]|nr:T9SS type A sorting domain-containing protein [Melioribacteraceae bacterium]